MSIVVTGATGHLGRLAIESLLAKGVPASQALRNGGILLLNLRIRSELPPNR